MVPPKFVVIGESIYHKTGAKNNYTIPEYYSFLDFGVILMYFANTPLYAPTNFQITPFWTYLGPHFYGNTVYVNTIIALDIDVSFLVFIKLTRFLVFNKRNFRFLVLKKRVSFLLFKKRVSYLVLKMPDRNLYPNKLKY